MVSGGTPLKVHKFYWGLAEYPSNQNSAL